MMSDRTWYFIYKVNNDLTPFLYAITDKKELKDSFLSERNPNFICKKNKVDKETEIELKKRVSQRILVKSAFETSDDDGIHDVYLTVTREEEFETFSHDNEILNIIEKNIDREFCYANKEISKALYQLLYFDFMKFIDYSDPFLDGIGNDEIQFSNYHFDRLGVFIELFGHTMKK